MTTQELLKEQHGTEVRVERARARETAAELALALGVTQQTVSRWEAGLIRIPDEMKVRIAARYGRNPNEMFALPLVASSEAVFPDGPGPRHEDIKEDSKCTDAQATHATDPRDGNTTGATDGSVISGTDAASSGTVKTAAVAS